MKVLRHDKKLCVGCQTCAEECAKVYFKTEDITKGALKIVEKVDDFNTMIACDQCGDCIDVCPVEAIYEDKNGIVRVNKKLCVGCLMCVGFCDKMFYHHDHVEPFKCVSCEICVKKCPTDALSMEVV